MNYLSLLLLLFIIFVVLLGKSEAIICIISFYYFNYFSYYFELYFIEVHYSLSLDLVCKLFMTSAATSLAVSSDDEVCGTRKVQSGARTPPTPPVQSSPSASPSASSRPLRQRSMAHLRPVSVPDIVMHMAGKESVRKMAEFDSHYMPDGPPARDASARGSADSYRADLKRKASDISRSLSEVFAYLTHGTASLEATRRLLSQC